MTVNPQERAFATDAVHAAEDKLKDFSTTGAVIAPISLSTTFLQHSPGVPVGEFEYARSSNPNRDGFEAAVARLEHGKHGIAFASGSAATAAIVQSLSLGSHIVALADVYGGTYRYFSRVALQRGISVTFVCSLEESLESIITNDTKLVWVESPSNPTLAITDIAAIAEITRPRGIALAVDNTFLSPYLCNPLTLGADIVVHSVSKYINGHSDVIMGVLLLNDDALHRSLRFMQNAMGAVPSPMDCWMATRGLKTLHLRMQACSGNALAVATALQASPLVVSVSYPGLKSHERYALSQKQHRDGLGGGMVSFRIQGGVEAARRFCSSTKIFKLAESLGGIESLVELPAVMTHASIPAEQRAIIGVHDDLIRMSCGIEDEQDLICDVMQALERAAVSSRI